MYFIFYKLYAEMEDDETKKHGIQLIREARAPYLRDTGWVETVEYQSTIINLKEVLTHRKLMRDAPAIFTNYIWKMYPTELDLDAMGFPKPVEVIRTTDTS